MTIYNFKNILFCTLRVRFERLETVLKESIEYNLANPEPNDYKVEILFNNQTNQLKTYLQVNNDTSPCSN